MIVAESVNQRVGTVKTLNGVITVSADQSDAGSTIAGYLVIISAPVEYAATGIRFSDEVVTVAPKGLVRASGRGEADRIVTVAAIDKIVSNACINEILTGSATDVIIAISTAY